MRSSPTSPSLWRTWNPATPSWAVFWSGAALVLTVLALFTSPHRPAFYGFLIIAWAGTLALVVAPAIIGRRHQQHAASGEARRRLPGRPHLASDPRTDNDAASGNLSQRPSRTCPVGPGRPARNMSIAQFTTL
jgi:hypothetical protein